MIVCLLYLEKKQIILYYQKLILYHNSFIYNKHIKKPFKRIIFIPQSNNVLSLTQTKLNMSINIFLILLLLLILWPILYYLRFYRHPIVIKLSAHPAELLVMPLEQLAQTKQLMQQTRRLDTVLAENEVDLTWLDEAIDFCKTSSYEKRAQLLAKRLNTLYENDKLKQIDENVFELFFSETFPLNFKRCLVYFCPLSLPAADVIRRLQKDDMYLRDVLVISLTPRQQAQLRPHGENLSTRWIVPNSRELSALLLHPKPIALFAALLAKQLTVTRLSPYKTTGGVSKETAFFGREKILAHILNRELTNYLIIGGRQVGKSSLLKRIQRHYKNHFQIDCHYLVLFRNNLREELTTSLNLPKNTSLDNLLEELGNVPKGRHRLLLIDEADKFIHDEIKTGYPILSYFRGLSEQGHCHFILAGFWELYDAAALNYQTPIKNFGQSLVIGQLEVEACWQLAKQPMEMLGIRYEKEQLVEQILKQTGQRANLIAIVCDKMLQNIGHEKRYLSEKEIEKALYSEQIWEALSGWTHLIDNDEQATRLDRIIVYATVKKGEFNQKALINFLNKQQYVYTAEQLNQSLKRLELAFILRRNKERYFYCVPLFRIMLQDHDISSLLKKELQSTLPEKATKE
jgi:hypothetical protein